MVQLDLQHPRALAMLLDQPPPNTYLAPVSGQASGGIEVEEFQVPLALPEYVLLELPECSLQLLAP